MQEDRKPSQEFDLLSCVRAITSDDWLRTYASTCLATGWDLLYAIYLSVAGHAADSLRMTMTGLYYFSVATVSVCVLVGFVISTRARDARTGHKRELVASLVGGVFLLSLNSMTALIISSTKKNWQVADYTKASFLILTLYTLVMLVLTARSWYRFRRDTSPVMTLAKGLSLCKAVMTFFFLALAAVQRYAANHAGFLQFVLGSVAGNAGVAAAVLSLVISVFTLVRSAHGLRDMERVGAPNS